MAVRVDQDNYRRFLASHEFCVLHCDAEWGVGARPIARDVIASAEREFGNRVGFGEIDVDQCVEISRELRISNVPTIAYYRAGLLVAALVGANQNVSERIRHVTRGEPIGQRDGTAPRAKP